MIVQNIYSFFNKIYVYSYSILCSYVLFYKYDK